MSMTPDQPPMEPPGPPQGGPPYMAQPGPDEITQNDKLWAALSYVFSPIIPIVVLLMDDTKNRRFPKYHAVQALGMGIVLYVAAILIYTILTAIFLGTLTLANAGFYTILSCFFTLIWLLPLAFAIYCAVQAYNGKYFSIPVLTDFLAGQKWLQKPGA